MCDSASPSLPVLWGDRKNIVRLETARTDAQSKRFKLGVEENIVWRFVSIEQGDLGGVVGNVICDGT